MSRSKPLPDAIFTAVGVKRDTNRWAWKYQENPPVGLIFVHRRKTLQWPVEAIMNHEIVRDMMGPIFFAGPYIWDTGDHALLVSSRADYTVDPVRKLNSTVWVSIDGQIQRHSIFNVYKSCRQLTRLMGCDRCPMRGEQCMQQNLKIPLPQPALPGMGDQHLDWDKNPERYESSYKDLEDYLASRKTKIAGYLYAPPRLFANEGIRPGFLVPRVEDVDIQGIGGMETEFSERSEAAAKTRNFKRTECTKCFMGGTGYADRPIPCNQWHPRQCDHGAWTKDEVIQLTLPPFKAALASGPRPMSLREFLGVLSIAGEEFWVKEYDDDDKKYVGRYKYIVGRVQFQSHGCQGIEVTRSACNLRCSDGLVNVPEMLKLLPENLRRKFHEPVELDDEMLTVAVHLTACQQMKPYSTGYFYYTASTSHVAAHHSKCIELGYWGCSFWRTSTFRGLRDLSAEFEGLPGLHVLHKYPALSLTAYPR
jgi:hypothetical protein